MQRRWSILAPDRQVMIYPPLKRTVYTWNTGVGLELELVSLGSWHVLAYARRWELYKAASCRCHVLQIIPSNFNPVSRKRQVSLIFLEDSSHHPIIYIQVLGRFGFSHPLSLEVTVGPCGTSKHHAVSQFDVDLFWQYGDVEIWGLMAFTYSTNLGLS